MNAVDQIDNEGKSEYEIAREFTEGLIVGVLPGSRDYTKSAAWLTGYDCGFEMRREKNRAINEYLESIGRDQRKRLCLLK